MRITSITTDAIFFGDKLISFYHVQDCCEENYADFLMIDDEALNTDFPEDLNFEAVHGAGFRFGFPGRMFFIPCYSEQNGYYSSDLDIYYCGKKVLSLACEEVLY